MGWTYTCETVGRDKKAWLDKRYTRASPNITSTVLKSAMVGTTYYAAVRVEETGNPAFVYGLIVLTDAKRKASDNYTFGWKDMDETMGPYECKAPAAVLDLLTPTTNKNALRWRTDCRLNLATGVRQRRERKSKPAPGDRIRFREPLQFSDGMSLQDFDVTVIKRRSKNLTVYRSVRTGGLYRIEKLHELAYDVVPNSDRQEGLASPKAA
jgi:hypothetical protein